MSQPSTHSVCRLSNPLNINGSTFEMALPRISLDYGKEIFSKYIGNLPYSKYKLTNKQKHARQTTKSQCLKKLHKTSTEGPCLILLKMQASECICL